MLKNCALLIALCALLAAASCSGAGQPGGLQDSSNTPQDASAAAPATSQGASGPALPRSASTDGIHYLVSVLALQASESDEGPIEGEGGGDTEGGGLGELLQGIIDWVTGEDSAGRTIDPHESAALGPVGFQVWRVVECSLGAALKQVSPGNGLPSVLAVGLESEPGSTAFATYGIKELPANWRLSSLRLGGRGDRFYVGISDYGQQSWRWLGPFSMGTGAGAETTLGSVSVTLPAVQNGNTEGFTYFTVVPAAGNDLTLTGVEATITDNSWIFDPGILDGDVLADF